MLYVLLISCVKAMLRAYQQLPESEKLCVPGFTFTPDQLFWVINHLLVKYLLVLYFLTLPHWNHQIQLGHAIDFCSYKNKHVYIQDYRLLLLHFDTVIILI